MLRSLLNRAVGGASRRRGAGTARPPVGGAGRPGAAGATSGTSDIERGGKQLVRGLLKRRR